VCRIFLGLRLSNYYGDFYKCRHSREGGNPSFASC
jgi:hypothetical protein